MVKQKVIKAKYESVRLPVNLTAIIWLLYRELNLTSTGKGAFIAIAVIVLTILWVSQIVRLFTTEQSDPKFED